MESPLAYCPRFAETAERLRALYSRQGVDRIFAVMNTPSEALAKFAAAHPAGYCGYPDIAERVVFWDEHLRRKAEVFDDSVPSAYLSECYQGLYGGMSGGSVQYMSDPDTGWISSMVPPLLDGWSGFEMLRQDLNSEVFQRYLEQLRIYASNAKGKFGLSHFILIDSLNYVFELVGATDTYMALFERPETVRKAVDFAYELNVQVQDAFFGAGVLVEGGTCSNMVQWIPGRIVSESLDPFHMTSVDDFEQWGREPIERILAHYDGGVAHIHGNGRHLLEVAATIKGLKALYLADDRGFPRAFDIAPEVRARLGELPLVLSCPYHDFVMGLESRTLTGGVLYQVTDVPDATTANRIMDAVRAYQC